MNKKFFLPCIAAIFIAALFIKNSELTALCVKKGLEECFLTIIPSLFPFMVVSEILIECGALDFLGRTFGKVFNRLFSLSEKSTSAVLSGLVFGFPIGTRALIALFDKEEISRDELERAIGFCGIPSFGFIVNAMGNALFSSKAFGFFMYITAIISALISGIVFSKRNKSEYRFVPTFPKKEKSTSEIITAAISSATGAVIILCAYVVFFSCIVGSLSKKIFSKPIGALIGAVLELTSGVLGGAEIGGILGLALCGFTVGFSGFSIHCQTMALVSDRVLSYRKYLAQKLFQGVLCALGAIGYSLVSDFTPESAEIAVFSPIFTPEYTAVVFILFFVCLSGCKKTLMYKKSPNAKR